MMIIDSLKRMCFEYYAYVDGYLEVLVVCCVELEFCGVWRKLEVCIFSLCGKLIFRGNSCEIFIGISLNIIKKKMLSTCLLMKI